MAKTFGIFAIWKPRGPSSNEVLEELRRRTGIRKIGHAGTLDPLAEGILVVGIGREATKKLAEAAKKEKEYTATIRLGMESTTDDEEGEKYSFPSSRESRNERKNLLQVPSREEVERVLLKFQGVIEQVPPRYSAVKIRGREAYKYARSGEEVWLRPRKVEIKEIEILEYRWPELKLRIVTGPGVYIRALARDIGRELGVGGYLAGLIRTRVGEFTKDSIDSSLALGMTKKPAA